MFSLSNSALVVVDAQKGFSNQSRYNSLPVVGAEKIYKNTNKLLKFDWARIDASVDWHPIDHCSFKGYGGQFDKHCCQLFRSAEFLSYLKHAKFHTIWRKGYQQDKDFFSAVKQHPGIPAMYNFCGIRNVFVCGLALDICVWETAQDFKQAGFTVSIVEDASAAFDPKKVEDQKRVHGGITYINTEELIKQINV